MKNLKPIPLNTYICPVCAPQGFPHQLMREWVFALNTVKAKWSCSCGYVYEGEIKLEYDDTEAKP
jgi:rubredoxin